jgi:hypothetical protein
MNQVVVTVDKVDITVTDEANSSVVVTSAGVTGTVALVTEGQQGPPGNFNINDTNKTDKSLIYYDGAAGIYKVDSTITKETITDGGNF